MNKIYNVNYGQLSFNDGDHLYNFVRYLFSQTKAHRENEHTEKNFYFRKQDGKNKFGFLNDPTKRFDSLIASIDFGNHGGYKNDLFDIYFFLEINGKIVTNIFTTDEDGLDLSFNDEVIAYIAVNYYNEDFDSLMNSIEDLVVTANSNQLEIFNFYDVFSELSIEELKEIELILHKNLQKQQEDESVIFQISHNDQVERPYHIHRLKLNL